MAITQSPAKRRWYDAALVICLAMVAAGVAMLPAVVNSIVGEFAGKQEDRLYDVMTGEAVVAGEDVDPGALNYLNLAVVDLDAVTGAVTLAVSGNRVCIETCQDVDLTFLSLDDDASRRRGVSPFATLSVRGDDAIFSETLELPARGTPVRYPFDDYELWLGVAAPPSPETGGEMPAPRPASSRFRITVQNQLPQMVMSPPVHVDPERIRRPSAALAVQVVQELRFTRPTYLTVLTVALVLLVAASGALSLLTQAINSLVLGVGGLILGIWGVRSVLVPQPIGVITAVDLALLCVIFLLLLGLAVRGALYLRRQSGLRLPRP